MFHFNKKNLIILVAAYLIVRIVFVSAYVDLDKKNYGEYGYITENMHKGYGYSLFSNVDGRANHTYDPVTKPHPSAYMPPGYVVFLYPFFYSNDIILRNLLITTVQILIGLVILFCLYKLTESYFSKSVAFIACWVYVLLPEFIYSVLVFNSIVFYHLLVLLVFLSLYKLEERNYRYSGLILISFLFGVCVYFRSEFVLFIVLFIGYLFIKKKFKNSVIVAGIVIIILSPWIIRNYIVFDRIVPMTTTSGLNFYRGNNNLYIGNWGDGYLIAKIVENRENPDYEVIMNDIYTNYTLQIIKDDPGKFIIDSGIKLFYYFTINPNEPNTRNPVYYIPWFIVLLLGIFGIYKSFNPGKFKFFYLFFLYSIIISVVFLPLPRYQIMMKILLLPFAAFGVYTIQSRYIKPFKKK